MADRGRLQDPVPEDVISVTRQLAAITNISSIPFLVRTVGDNRYCVVKQGVLYDIVISRRAE